MGDPRSTVVMPSFGFCRSFAKWSISFCFNGYFQMARNFPAKYDHLEYYNIDVFAPFGLPIELVSDNGPQITYLKNSNVSCY